MKRYCIVYLVTGIHYRARVYAKTKREAIKICLENMQINRKDIVEVYTED